MVQFLAAWDDGVQVRWRSLTWAEYRKFKYKMLTRPLGAALEIYTCVVLEGPELEALPAGIARFVADFVLVQTPFSGKIDAVGQALEASRSKLAETYLLSAQALISHIFHYRLEEIEAWDPELFFERLAQAEFIAGKQLQPAAPKPVKRAASGNLWEQEKLQNEAAAAADPPPQPRAYSSTQAKAIARTKQARRGNAR